MTQLENATYPCIAKPLVAERSETDPVTSLFNHMFHIKHHFWLYIVVGGNVRDLALEE